MSERMVSWCVVSSSVKKVSCVRTFVHLHTLLLFPYPPSCIDIPRGLAWSTENLDRRVVLRTCSLCYRVCLLGICLLYFVSFCAYFFRDYQLDFFSRSCYSRWDGPSVLPGCPKWRVFMEMTHSRPRMGKTNNGIKHKSVKGCCYHYGSPGVIFWFCSRQSVEWQMPTQDW